MKPVEERKPEKKSFVPSHVELKSRHEPEPEPQQMITEGGVRIKANYVRKPAEEVNTEKCPLCRRMIPSSEINDHLRIEMLDPKYKEVKKEMESRAASQKFTGNQGEEFYSTLKNIASKRPDLFGTAEDEFMAEEQGKGGPALVKQPVWDGVSAGLTRTTASIAMMAQQQRKNIEETVKALGEKISGPIGPTPPQPKGVTTVVPVTGQAQPSNQQEAQAPAPVPVHAFDLSKQIVIEGGVSVIPQEQWLQMYPVRPTQLT